MENIKLKTGRAPGALIIVAYILTFLEICAAVFLMTKITSFAEIAILVVSLIAKVLAILYFAKGYGKNANLYFRWYFLMLAFSLLIENFLCIFADYGMISYSDSMVFVVQEMICYGNLLLIGLAKDLGKKLSVTLVSVNILVFVVRSFQSIYAYSLAPSDDGLVTMIATGAWFLGSIVRLLMVLAKYSDKESRGSK